MEVVNSNEKSEERRQRILTELSNLITGAPLASLDSKSRDAFQPKFTSFKSFVQEFNS